VDDFEEPKICTLMQNYSFFKEKHRYQMIFSFLPESLWPDKILDSKSKESFVGERFLKKFQWKTY